MAGVGHDGHRRAGDGHLELPADVRDVVVVTWAYDTTCRPVPWTRSALRLSPGLRAVAALALAIAIGIRAFVPAFQFLNYPQLFTAIFLLVGIFVATIAPEMVSSASRTSSTRITCQPNWLFTGASVIWPFCSLIMASENSGT